MRRRLALGACGFAFLVAGLASVITEAAAGRKPKAARTVGFEAASFNVVYLPPACGGPSTRRQRHITATRRPDRTDSPWFVDDPPTQSRIHDHLAETGLVALPCELAATHARSTR